MFMNLYIAHYCALAKILIVLNICGRKKKEIIAYLYYNLFMANNVN